ncbi:MAG: type IV toxin-antitoxin system AbiEi family antitoxin domain-containing protein [Candidatus Omnitrophota bacterium]
MYEKLLKLKLKQKPYFTVEDLAEVWKIKPASAKVVCSRYVKKGIFIRLKKNFYILEENWEHFSRDHFLRTANFLQVPSYVSFMTALSLHEVTTQVQRDFYESASVRRSVQFTSRGVVFNFYKLKQS